MRKLAFLAPLAAVLAVAASPAMAEPASINVTVGDDLQKQLEELGPHDVQRQVARLGDVVRRALSRNGALDGAQVDLVLTDLKPNRPTVRQPADQPGLDGLRSLSVGGASIEGQITTADGRIVPVRYDWYSSSLADARGSNTWQDADRAYRVLAVNLAEGRYVTR